MNIRELWDTVVLRDILGYIFPGAVTLFALALLITGPECTTACKLITEVVKILHLNDVFSQEHWLPWHPWVLFSALLALSYVTGYLQNQLIAILGERTQRWTLGTLTLQLLNGKDSPTGGMYCQAAREMLDERHRKEFRDLCSTVAPDHCQKQVKKARELFYWCNYHVHKEAPDIHATWVGRYYVLTILFSNLGFSTFALAFGLGAVAYQSTKIHGLAALLILLVFSLIALIFFWASVRFKRAYVQWTFQILSALLAEKHLPRQLAEGPAKKILARRDRRARPRPYPRRR